MGDSHANSKKVGERIKVAREAKGLSIDELAEFLGYQDATPVRHLEEGGSVFLQYRNSPLLCEALGVSDEYFFGGLSAKDGFTTEVTLAEQAVAENGEYAKLGEFTLKLLAEKNLYGRRTDDIDIGINNDKRNPEVTANVQKATKLAMSKNLEVAEAGKELLTMYTWQGLFGKREGEKEKFGL